MMAEGDVLCFARLGGDERVLVVANLDEGTVEAELPQAAWKVTGATPFGPVLSGAQSVTLGPWRVCVLRAPS